MKLNLAAKKLGAKNRVCPDLSLIKFHYFANNNSQEWGEASSEGWCNSSRRERA